MLFNSYPFVFVFLPLVLAGFAVLTRWRSRTATLAFLIVASLAFYAWWNWRFLGLLLFSILFNFALGRRLQRRASERGAPVAPARRLLALGIAVNVGLLGYFKYRNFLVDTVGMAVGTDWALPPIVLPLAISFFTFEQITYLVDAYHGDTGEYDFLGYALFISFFPHLIAGPIVRFKELVPQFSSRSTFVFSHENVARGLFIFAIGLFKKVMIADTFSPWVAPIFDRAPVVVFSDAWGATLAFALQLYFDFSGYTDMAIGLALMLNVVLPENFDSPYQARSIIDFWRRWHMTLSNFLRDYLYIPLGGGRRGEARRYANLFITMLLGGLWHGASWTFVLWGGLHGAYLAINHLWRRRRPPSAGAGCVGGHVRRRDDRLGLLPGAVAGAGAGHPGRDGWPEWIRLADAAVLDRRQSLQDPPARAGRRVVVSQPAGDHDLALEERLRLRRRLRDPGGREHPAVRQPVPIPVFPVLNRHAMGSVRRLRLMLLCLAGFLAAVAAINWIVNPYGAWRSTVIDPAHRVTRSPVGASASPQPTGSAPSGRPRSSSGALGSWWGCTSKRARGTASSTRA